MGNPYSEKLQEKLSKVAEADSTKSGNKYLDSLMPKLEALPGQEVGEKQPQEKDVEKPESGFGASFWEGIQDVVRSGLEFLQLEEEATDTGKVVERHKAAQKKGAGPLQMLNTPGQNEEIGRAISAGEDPKEALDRARAARVKALQKQIDKWQTSPDYNPPDKGFAKYMHDFTRMAPLIASQMIAAGLTGPIGGTALMATQIIGGQTQQLEAEGVEDPMVRMQAAARNAMWQAPMEQIGINRLTKLFKPNRTFMKALKEVGKGMTEEWLTETLQGIPDWATEVWAKTEGKGLSGKERMDMFWNGLADALKQSAYEGLVAAPLGAAGGGIKATIDYSVSKQQELPGSPEKTPSDIPPESPSPDIEEKVSSPDIEDSDLARATGAREDILSSVKREKAPEVRESPIEIQDSGQKLGLVHEQLTKFRLAQEAKKQERLAEEKRGAERLAQKKLQEQKALQAEAAVSKEISKQRAIKAESQEGYENLKSQRLENDEMKAARMANEYWMKAFEHPQMQETVVSNFISKLENAEDKKDQQGRVIAKPLGTQFNTKEARLVGGLLRKAHRAIELENVDTKKIDEILYDLKNVDTLVGSDPKSQAVFNLLTTQLEALRERTQEAENAQAEAKSKAQKSVQATVDRFKQRYMPEKPVDMGPVKREKAPEVREVPLVVEPPTKAEPQAEVLSKVEREKAPRVTESKIELVPGPPKQEGPTLRSRMTAYQHARELDKKSKAKAKPTKAAVESAKTLGLIPEAEAKTDKEKLQERMRTWKIYVSEDSAKRALRKFKLQETHEVVPYGDRYRITPKEEKVEAPAKPVTTKPEPKVVAREEALRKQEAPAEGIEAEDYAKSSLETKARKKAREVKEFLASKELEKSEKMAAKTTSSAVGEGTIASPRIVEPSPKKLSEAKKIVEEVKELKAEKVGFVKELHQLSGKVSQGTFDINDASRVKAILGRDIVIHNKTELDRAIDHYQARYKITEKDIKSAKTMQERLKEFQRKLPKEERLSKGSLKGIKGLQVNMVKSSLRDLTTNAKKALPTVVLDTQKELPEHLRSSLTKDKIEGVWDPKTKKVYMVAENLTSTQRAVEVWLHEQVGHYGLLKLFSDRGADFNQFLDHVYPVLKKRASKALAEVREEYADNLAKLSERDQQRLIVEEFLARRSEKLKPEVRKKIFQRFLDFINNWIKHVMGYRKAAPVQLKMKDLDALLETAKNYLMHGELREWLEFKETDKTYKDWAKEVLEKNPRVLTWFDNHKQWTNKVFKEDARLFDVLLGLTSAGSNMKTNTKYAVDAYLFLAGKSDKMGGRFPKNVAKNLKLAQRYGIFSGQFKLDEFVRGLLGDEKATTNDMWMHRLLFGDALLSQNDVRQVIASEWLEKTEKHFSGETTGKMKTLKNLDSKFLMPENTAARHKLFQLSQELTEETGEQWTPRSVQAALWVKAVAAANEVDLEGVDYDYGHTFMMEPIPSFNGLTPHEYLKTQMAPDEIGKVSEKVKIKPYPEISKLEKAYVQQLRKKGIKQIDPYSTHVEDQTLIHYRSEIQEEARGLGFTETPPFYSQNDVGERIAQHSTKHPYVPYSYWYGPTSKPETGLAYKKPHQTKLGKLRIYDGRNDALELWGKAYKQIAAAQKKHTPAHIGNVFAALVREEGYDGFSINKEGQGDWYALFEPQPLMPPIASTVRLSEVIEGIEDLPQEISPLAQMAAERGPALRTELERELKHKYPSVRVKKSQNSVARFGTEGTGATSGKMEYGLSLDLEGPLNAIRAAMSELVGLGKGQRMVFVEYDPSLVDEASSGAEGRHFKFTVAPGLTPAQIQRQIDNAGITDYNLTSDGRNRFIDMFLGDWVPDEEVRKFRKLFEDIGSKGTLEHYTTYSDVLGDLDNDGTSQQKAHESYRKHLEHFFGKSIGKRRFEEGRKAGANYEQTVAALGKPQGISETAGTLKRGAPSRDRSSADLSQPTKTEGREEIDLRPRFSRKVPEDLRSLYKYAGKPKTTTSAIDVFKRAVMSDWKAGWDKVVSRFLDHLNPLKVLEKGQELGAFSAYRSFRLMSTVPNILGTLLHQGHIRYDKDSHWVAIDRDRLDGGLIGALEKLGPEAEYWKYWMLGESVKELIKRRGLEHPSVQHFFGKDEHGSWIDPVEALAEIDKKTAPRKTKKWDEIKKTFAEYNKTILDFATKANVLDPAGVEIWKRETYIPANRMMEKWGEGFREEEMAGYPRSKAKHIGGVKELKGGEQHIGDPLENLLANYAYLLQESLKNISRLKAYGVLKDTGILTNGRVTDPNSIAIKVAGVAKYYRVLEPDVFRALVDLPPAWLKTFKNVVSPVKHLITGGITITSAFRIANFVRDTLATWVISGNFKPFVDSTRNFWGAWRESADMVELRSAGGAFSGSYANADNPLKFDKVIQKAIHKNDPNPLHPKRAFEWWERVGTAAENAARLGLYRNERARGATIEEAAYKAKDLMDFSMHGSLPLVGALTSMVPFLNARFQGLYKLGRTGLNKKTRAGFMRRGAILALASMGLAVLNGAFNTEKWDDLPDEDRWLYFHIWLPESAGGHVRIPMPFEVGALFGALPTMLVEFLRKENKEAWKDLARFMTFTLTQTMAIDPVALGRPAIDVWRNKSEFTGRPIVGRAQEGIDPGQRYSPWTSKTLRGLGKLFPKHFSPKQVEHILQQYFHGYWDLARIIGDHVMMPLVTEFPEDPALTREDYWVTSRFMRNQSSRHIRHEREFYEILNEVDQTYRTFSYLKSRGDIQGAWDYLKKNRPAITKAQMLNKYTRAFSKLRTREQLIYHNRTKSAEQKRRELDSLRKLKQKLFRRAIKEIKRDES